MKLYPPLRNLTITQVFGVNPQNYIKFGDYGHNGVDYRCVEGTDLYSPIDGEIIKVGWDAIGYGLFYRIKNDFFECILAHLKENYLPQGSKVSKGQLIGKTGNTGNSTGPHLHFGVRIKGMSNPQISNYSDPIWYLNNEDPDASRLQKELDNCREDSDTKTDQIEKLQGQLSKSNTSLAKVEAELTTCLNQTSNPSPTDNPSNFDLPSGDSVTSGTLESNSTVPNGDISGDTSNPPDGTNIAGYTIPQINEKAGKVFHAIASFFNNLLKWFR